MTPEEQSYKEVEMVGQELLKLRAEVRAAANTGDFLKVAALIDAAVCMEKEWKKLYNEHAAHFYKS